MRNNHEGNYLLLLTKVTDIVYMIIFAKYKMKSAIFAVRFKLNKHLHKIMIISSRVFIPYMFLYIICRNKKLQQYIETCVKLLFIACDISTARL